MTKIKDIFTNLGGVKVSTWIRLIMLVLSLVNLILGAFNIAPITCDENELYTVVSVIFAVITGVVTFWKNNSFTSAAQAADEYLHNQQLAVEDTGEEITE